ncbi:MAG: hypothetical protein ACYCWW_06345 [Deltaproteobacteria bacterium]
MSSHPRSWPRVRAPFALACALVACSAPAGPTAFPVDEAIGAFARDPASPVIARSQDQTAPDYLGATAPSVWSDGQGRHAAYLGLDADGGRTILVADSADGHAWTKRPAPLVPSDPSLGRPAALATDGGLVLYYAKANAAGGTDVVLHGGGVVVPGADQPAALAAGGHYWIYAVADGGIHAFASDSAKGGFQDQGIVLAAGADGGFDAFSVSAPAAIAETSALGRTLFRLWYAGVDSAGDSPSIGLAGAFDGTTFEKYVDDPVRFHGDVPSVFPLDGGFAMLYSETSFENPTDISLATRP